MSSGDGIKFSSKRPKGSKWGVSDVVQREAETFQETGHAGLIPCMTFLTIDSVKLTPGDGDEPVLEITVKVAAIESLDSQDARRRAHLLVLKESQKRLGSGDGGQMTLPFELKEMFEEAFGSRTFDEVQQDEKEAEMDANMDDPARLRQHLIVVHNHDRDKVMEMEWVDVRQLHDSDHARPAEDGVPPHDPDWWAWRRVDLLAAEAEADGTPDAFGGEDPATFDVTHEEDGSDQDGAADEDDTADDTDDQLPDNVTEVQFRAAEGQD